MKAFSPIIALLLLLAALPACHPAKHIQAAIAKKDTTVQVVVNPDLPKEDTAAIIREQLAAVKGHHIDFTTFSAKVDVDYRDGNGKKYDVNAHIRMYRDSVIWISITGPLGIEGLRAYITRDSVKMINKQDKIYTRRSVSYLQEVSALPLDLSSLQDLLVGNPLFLDSNVISFLRSPGLISLQSNGEYFKNLFTIGETDKLTQSSKLDDLDEMRSRTCFLTYGDYEDKGSMKFATRRTINVTEKNKLDISLNFKQYAFNETLSFPFTVPKSYKLNEQ